MAFFFKKMESNLKINLINDPEITENSKAVATENKPTGKSTISVRIKKIFISLTIFLVIAFAIFASSIAFSNENLIKNITNLNFLGQIGGLITSGDRPLKGEEEDRINFVLIGIGGKNHEAGTLADTLIVGSYKPSLKQVALMSLPRDLYVKYNNSWTKINAVHAYAEKRKRDSGGKETMKFVSQLLNLEFHYYAVIDFDGFEKLINEFDGLDVYVDNDLIDNQYPIKGREEAYPIASRFERLVIKQGWHHFDGETALKYARSRYAFGIEGSDFARSKRQQKIILAVKDKVLQPGFLINPAKISSLMNAYAENISTNIQLWEILKLMKVSREVDYENPITYSLVDGPTPLLYDQRVNGAYVLLPYGGNFEKVNFVFENIFTLGTSTVSINRTKWDEFKEVEVTTPIITESIENDLNQSTTTKKNSAIEEDTTSEEAVNQLPLAEINSEISYINEKASIQILNGTTVAGWAGQESAKLKAKKFTVISVGNFVTRDQAEIKIYDFSGGTKNLTLLELKTIYGVPVSTPPENLKSSADILIVLGK
jgi:polyisoprenyl-teichoic acid--peptidoglycan teichoic acid transferase